MIADRFWKHVAKSDGCWNWVGAHWKKYGCIRRGSAREGFRLAHRVSYELAHGAIPDGMAVLHTCDNGSCVRPDHLFLGSQTDNVRDMDSKGRRRNNKLTPDMIRAARARSMAGETQASIARDFGVVQTTISQALRGLTWRHVS